MTYAEAQRAAKRIRDYWAGLGYTVRVTVVQDRETSNASGHSRTPWLIQTDLVNGLPRKARAGVHETIIKRTSRQ